MPLKKMLSDCWQRIQGDLFPWLEEELGPLSDKHKQIITVLEVARIQVFVQTWSGLPGSPPVKLAPLATEKRERRRPKKGGVVARRRPRRLPRQAGMTLTGMLADLPTACN